jgi:hypothetical protein
VTTITPAGAAKSLYLLGSVGRLILTWPGVAGVFAALTALSRAWIAAARVWTGPATSRFLSSKTYQPVGVPLFACACCVASRS